jgi:class 3 adenylate cyclase
MMSDSKGTGHVDLLRYYEDFRVFQTNVLCTLSSTIPLADNLRAVIAPSLAKLMKYVRAAIGLHLFVDKELGIVHSIIVGGSSITKDAIARETKRRYDLVHSRVPSCDQPSASEPDANLPNYSRFRVPDPHIKVLHQLAASESKIKVLKSPNEIKWLLEEIDDHEDFKLLDSGHVFLLVPLGFKPFNRLGMIILCFQSKSKHLAQEIEADDKILTLFKRMLEQLIVRLYSYYHLPPESFLPTCHRSEMKHVAVMCVQIRNFDWLCDTLRQHPEKREIVLRKLITLFCRTVSEIVECPPYRGRVDQIWGSGLVVVFGEHSTLRQDAEEGRAFAPCKLALEAAAKLVAELEGQIEELFRSDSDLKDLRWQQNEALEISPSVAIDYGEVVLDYVGSRHRRVYLVVGERVELVKCLAAMASGPRMGDQALELVLREMMDKKIPRPQDPFRIAPILVSQSAYHWMQSLLKDANDQRTGKVHTPHMMRLPGRLVPYPVYEVFPENLRSWND